METTCSTAYAEIEQIVHNNQHGVFIPMADYMDLMNYMSELEGKEILATAAVETFKQDVEAERQAHTAVVKAKDNEIQALRFEVGDLKHAVTVQKMDRDMWRDLGYLAIAGNIVQATQ